LSCVASLNNLLTFSVIASIADHLQFSRRVLSTCGILKLLKLSKLLNLLHLQQIKHPYRILFLIWHRACFFDGQLKEKKEVMHFQLVGSRWWVIGSKN
jgi:hypothetical protein